MKRPKEIHIDYALNGFVVRCGCQLVVFESREKMTSELARYLADPDGVEKQYLSEAINPMDNCPTPQCEAPQRAAVNRVIEPSGMGGIAARSGG